MGNLFLIAVALLVSIAGFNVPAGSPPFAPKDFGLKNEAKIVGEVKEQCEKCRVRFYGSVWELVFEKQEGWIIQGDSEDIENVIAANGKQWYSYKAKNPFPAVLSLVQMFGDGEVIYVSFSKEGFVQPSVIPESAISEFKAVGWKGKLYDAVPEKGIINKEFVFALPDKKYQISVQGKGPAFEEFIKKISLEK